MNFHAFGMKIHLGAAMKRFFGILVGCILSAQVWAVVDLNTANQAQLEGVSGIGPSKAKAIIDYRTKNGVFKTVDELDKVPGFGKATLDKLRTELSVGGVRPPALKVDAGKSVKK